MTFYSTFQLPPQIRMRDSKIISSTMPDFIWFESYAYLVGFPSGLKLARERNGSVRSRAA